MQYLRQKFNNNERNMHFLLYCYTFFIYGAAVNGLGPLIPYFSQYYKIPQTQYSVMFPGRTLGYVSGALISKIITKKFQYHTIMVYSALAFSLTAFAFAQSQQIFWQTFFIFLNTIVIAVYDVITNTSVLIFNKDEDKQFWVQIGHGLFGVGCLISPILVYFLQFKLYSFFAIINLIIIYGYHKLQTPEGKKQVRQTELQQIKKQLSSDIDLRDQNQQKTNMKIKEKYKQNLVTNKILMLLSILIFLLIGEQVSFGVWIPSYSVLMKISSKQQATIYSTLFYLSITISRFISATIPTNSSTSKRIKLFLIFSICVSFIAIIFHYFSPHFGCYFVSILYGIALAPLFSFYFTISVQNKLVLKDNHYSTMMIVGVFGQAILASIVGYMLNYTLAMIFMSMIFFTLLQFYALFMLDKEFQKQNKNRMDLLQK